MGESSLRQQAHHLGPGEGLAEEDDIGELGLNLCNRKLPESNRLGVGVVDAEDPHPALGPEEEDVPKFIPEGLPVGVVVVERIDILVFFWGDSQHT